MPTRLEHPRQPSPHGDAAAGAEGVDLVAIAVRNPVAPRRCGASSAQRVAAADRHHPVPAADRRGPGRSRDGADVRARPHRNPRVIVALWVSMANVFPRAKAAGAAR